MANIDGFNAAEVDPNVGFPVLPAGEYEVVIVESKSAMTKKGDGQLFKLTLQVVSGPEQNKKLFDQINWKNPSAECQAIGRATLSSICRAVNVLTPKNTEELHMKPLRAKVVIKDDPQYGKKNEVKAYMPRSGVSAPMANPLAVASASPASGATPW